MGQQNASSIAILGSGAFGTALAILLGRLGHSVILWSRTSEHAATLERERQNSAYLPGVPLPDTVRPTADTGQIGASSLVLIALPAQHFRKQAAQFPALKSTPILLCNKGIEVESLKLMSEVAGECFPGAPLAILSGPGFADEIARGLPTALTVAASDASVLQTILPFWQRSTVRLYPCHDIIGAQLGGAVKNIIAIACGIAMGKQLGESARAALITRALVEIERLMIAKGGKQETLTGLCGIGDLVLTCNSTKSRNLSLGIALGQDMALHTILEQRGSKVTEGVATAKAVHALAKQLKVDMPICEGVYRILHENAPIDHIIASLLNRPSPSL